MVKRDVKKESFFLESGIIVEDMRVELESTESEELKRGEDEEQSRKARAFEAAQHSQTWKEAIRRNPKALGWCAYSLFTCVMWGYDGLASSVCLFPLFLSDIVDLDGCEGENESELMKIDRTSDRSLQTRLWG